MDAVKWPRAGAACVGVIHACPELAPAPGTNAWPTPDATASNDGETWQTWSARREKHRARGIYNGTPLAQAVKDQGEDVRLCAEWTEAVMGWPVGWTGSHGLLREAD